MVKRRLLAQRSGGRGGGRGRGAASRRGELKLSPDHYRPTCPDAELTVRSVVTKRVRETFSSPSRPRSGSSSTTASSSTNRKQQQKQSEYYTTTTLAVALPLQFRTPPSTHTMAMARSLALPSSCAAGAGRPEARRAGRWTRVVAAAAEDPARRLVAAFDPAIPLASAVTPPSGWYTDPEFLGLELDCVFLRGWQAVGHIGQVKNPNDFFTGRLGKVEFVICRDANGKLHGFHNVCRHHASLLACGSGQKTCFQCPYHGWTYGLDGILLKATRISGIKNFNKNDFGLVPIKVATWGPFVLVRFDDDFSQDTADDVVGDEWLGSASDLLGTNGIDTSLPHICRREYIIKCNWKVFCDNYLDGGYHVPYAHGALASGLQLQSYETLTYERVSVQRCESAPAEQEDIDRLGTKAVYAFVYPNFMINRYGPWMDTNLAVPLDATTCKVVFDYFLDKYLLDDHNFIERSLKDSEQVQMEDIALCEGVQRGLESPAYSVGRYAPSVEMAMHHFHCLLHANLSSY